MVIPKTKIQEIIDLTREFVAAELADIDDPIQKRILAAKKLDKEVGINWISFIDLMDSILRYRGFMPDADDDVIYQVLALVGVELV
jgi:hypothetical protein